MVKLRFFVKNTHNFFAFLGVGLIHPHERRLAKRCGRYTYFVLAVLSIMQLLQWQMYPVPLFQGISVWMVDAIIWMLFFVAYILLFVVVKNTKRFVIENWLFVVVIVFGVAVVTGDAWVESYSSVIRPALAFVLILPVLRVVAYFFIDGRLVTTLLATGLIVVEFGVFVAGIDPGVRSASDGIWWALATVTTVGYGDVVPVSIVGRAVGALLVISGLGVFVVITANILRLMLRKEAEAAAKKVLSEDDIIKEIETVYENQKSILDSINTIRDRKRKKY